MGRTRNRALNGRLGISVVDDLIVFEAYEGPTEHSPLGFVVEIAVRTVPAKKMGKRNREGLRILHTATQCSVSVS